MKYPYPTNRDVVSNQLCRECGINEAQSPSGEGDCEACAKTRELMISISRKINFMCKCGLLNVLNNTLSKHRVTVIRAGEKSPTIHELSIINIIWNKYDMDTLSKYV